MKNIFIEGIQGMGKTTLLNGIKNAFPEMHICREGDYSPIDLAWCAWMTEKEYDDFVNQYEALRQDMIKNTVREQGHLIVTYTKVATDVTGFFADAEKYEIYNGRKTLPEVQNIILSRYEKFSGSGYLFECSLFQNIIEDLILFHQLSDDEIVMFYRELYDRINKEEFLLLYLYSEKIEDVIAAVKNERCDTNGNPVWYRMMMDYLVNSPYGKEHQYHSFEDMIEHFCHRQHVEMRIIKEVLGENAVILPTKEWEIDDVITWIK